jgi:ribosomal protein S24E
MAESELNILAIDSKIKKGFENEYKKLPQYTERLIELERTIATDNLPFRARNDLVKNISELRKKIGKLRTNQGINFYIVETAEYIQKYKHILKTPLKVSFVGKPTRSSKEKKEIIAKYIEIAQKYCEISVQLPVKKTRIVCNNCPNKRNFEIVENTHICLECGAQQEILQHTSSYKDIDRVNISTKYKYDKKTHFRDCINQYQGKQNCTIDQKVYDSLEDASYVLKRAWTQQAL